MTAAITSVETNIVVRFLTDDDHRQALAARSLFASGPIWIGKTVLLEAAWVLESIYGFDQAAICAALTGLLGFGNVQTDDKASIAGVIALASAGLDLADAMHLTDRPGSAFATFDRKLVRRAKRARVTAISAL